MRTTTLCAIHNKHERAGKFYRICFECGHLFRKPIHIQLLDLEIMQEYGDLTATIRPIDKIYSCPLCIHDW